MESVCSVDKVLDDSSFGAGFESYGFAVVGNAKICCTLSEPYIVQIKLDIFAVFVLACDGKHRTCKTVTDLVSLAYLDLGSNELVSSSYTYGIVGNVGYNNAFTCVACGYFLFCKGIIVNCGRLTYCLSGKERLGKFPTIGLVQNYFLRGISLLHSIAVCILCSSGNNDGDRLSCPEPVVQVVPYLTDDKVLFVLVLKKSVAVFYLESLCTACYSDLSRTLSSICLIFFPKQYAGELISFNIRICLGNSVFATNRNVVYLKNIPAGFLSFRILFLGEIASKRKFNRGFGLNKRCTVVVIVAFVLDRELQCALELTYGQILAVYGLCDNEISLGFFGLGVLVNYGNSCSRILCYTCICLYSRCIRDAAAVDRGVLEIIACNGYIFFLDGVCAHRNITDSQCPLPGRFILNKSGFLHGEGLHVR